jgi:hypothetical protein
MERLQGYLTYSLRTKYQYEIHKAGKVFTHEVDAWEGDTRNQWPPALHS